MFQGTVEDIRGRVEDAENENKEAKERKYGIIKKKKDRIKEAED